MRVFSFSVSVSVRKPYERTYPIVPIPRNDLRAVFYVSFRRDETCARHAQNNADVVADLLPTDVLCDDHTPNLNGWVRSGGKAVKIINEVNGLCGTFTAGPRVKIETDADLMRAIGVA